MSCARYRQLLSRYVDGEVTPRQRQELLAHVQTCRECATWLAKARQTDVLLKGINTPGPSDRVRSAVLDSVRQRSGTGPLKADKSVPAQGRRRTGRLRLSAAWLLLRFDVSAGRVAFVAVAVLAAITGLAYATGVIPPLWGYSKLGFEFPSTSGHKPVGITPLPIYSQGNNGVGGQVSVPSAVEMLPQDEAASVSPGSPFSVRFDQPMDPASVEGSFSIDPPVAGTFKWPADNEVSFIPGQPGLLRGVTYTVTLSSTARSIAGTPLDKPLQWSFRTLGTHDVQPRVMADTRVPLTATLGLVFDAPMDRDSTAANVGLYSDATGEKLPATFTWQPDSRALRISPTGLLPAGKISLRVSEGALTQAGDTLGRAYEFAYEAAQIAPWLKLSGGRVRVMRAGEADLDYSGAADSRGTPLVGVAFDVYRLPAERLSELAPGARTWPSSLPAGYPAVLQHVKSFRSGPHGVALEQQPTTTEDLPPGLYLLTARASSGTSDWQLLVVADRSIALAGAANPWALWATTEAGQPWQGAEVSLYGASGNLIEKGATGQEGLWHPTEATQAAGAVLSLARDLDGHLAALALDPDALAKFAPNSATNTLPAVVHTDRTGYEPGQTVNFRVLLRKGTATPRPQTNTGDTASMADPASTEAEQDVTVQLRTPGRATLSTLTLRPDSAGGVGGLFALSPDAAAGTYGLRVQAGGEESTYPVQVVAPAHDALSVFILPSEEYTVTESLALTRTVSVLDANGAPAHDAVLTATLGIDGDSWATEPVTATTNEYGRATFVLSLPGWAIQYSDPGMYLTVAAGAADKSGKDTQYLDLVAPEGARADLPQLTSPSMGVSAVALARTDGTISVLLADLGAGSTEQAGDVLLTAYAPSGERWSQVVDLAVGRSSVELPARFAGGTVSILRAGGTVARQLLMPPADNRSAALSVQGPQSVEAGAEIPLSLKLESAQGMSLGGVASVWMERVSGPADSEAQPAWEPSLRLQATEATTATLRAPSAPGLWYVVAEAATAGGTYAQSRYLVRVEPGLAVQLPPASQVSEGQPQTMAVVVHNTTNREATFSIAGSASEGLSLLGGGSQAIDIEAGGWRRLGWQFRASRPGRSSLQIELSSIVPGDSAAGPTASTAWVAPITAVADSAQDATFTSGELSEEQDIAVHVPSGLDASSVQLEIRASTSLLPALGTIADGLPSAPGQAAQGVALSAARLSSAPAVDAAYRVAGGKSGANSALDDSSTARSLLLQEIYSAQHPDGGWGANLANSGGAESSSRVASTAQVLLALRRFALASIDSAAATIDAAVVSKGLMYLSGQLARPLAEDSTTADLDERAFGLYVLSLYGNVGTGQIRPLMQYVASGPSEGSKLSNVGQAWLALALWQVGDTADALAVFERAVASHTAQDTAAMAPMLELAVGAAEALRKGDLAQAASRRDAAAYDALAGQYADELMSSRQGLGWDSPTSTGNALWALSLYAAQQEVQSRRATPDISINDHPVQVAQPSDGHAASYPEETNTISVVLNGDALHAGTNWLKLRPPDAGGTLYYSLTLKAVR